MTKDQFVATCIEIATKKPSLYVMGGYGQKLTPEWKEYFITGYGFNRCIDSYGHDRKQLILDAPEDTLAYDCVCSIKSIINGCKGYTTSPCPDISIAALLRECSDRRIVSNNTRPAIGDFLTFKDFSHCGIYVGNDQVFEATYSGKDGAQLRQYQGRGWYYAGDLPYFDKPEPKPVMYIHGVQVMANTSKSNAKKYLRKGQSTFYVDGWYKNAYTYDSIRECEEHLASIQKKYPDAFITKYKADSLVIY